MIKLTENINQSINPYTVGQKKVPVYGSSLHCRENNASDYRRASEWPWRKINSDLNEDFREMKLCRLVINQDEETPVGAKYSSH